MVERNGIMKARPLAIVIMAAGQGKRMKNPNLAKVLHPLAGIPLIEHVIRLARTLEPERIITIVGHQRDSVIAHLNSLGRDIECVIQEEQHGTGHAVLQTKPLLADFNGDVLILSGDAPLTRRETIEHMLAVHRRNDAAVTVLTAILPDPAGYGRILRNEDGSIHAIVEHKDATEQERMIDEINSGIYVFDCVLLFEALGSITNDNAQGEYYLPDVFRIFSRQALPMYACVVDSPDEIRGVNTIEQLEEMERLYIELKSEHMI